MAPDQSSIVSPAEAALLFRDLATLPAIVLAVSGGPDSTALMWLTARWRAGLAHGPTLTAITIDHGLRPESAVEARAVAALARKLRIPHRTVRWTGPKPSTRLQEAARAARYRLLAQAAQRAGACAILTAHTRDDQAETVLIRLARGSGVTGLAGMRRVSAVPGLILSGGGGGEGPSRGCMGEGISGTSDQIVLVRPFLSIPKTRLIASLRAEGIPFAEDPSNRDPRFTRARLRGLMPALAEEGLDAARLALLAERVARADAALRAEAERSYASLAKPGLGGRIILPAADFMALAGEIRLRILGRAVDETGDEGPVELGKLEVLEAALVTAYRSRSARFRRSLAGALVTLTPSYLAVERAPPRRKRTLNHGGKARKAAAKRQ